MKKIKVVILTLLLISLLSFSSFAIDIPEPTSNFFVNDFADVISEENEQEIMKIGADLYEQTSAQVIVVTVNSLEGYEVNDYALELGREWGVGSKETSNGCVILLSVNDREITIQVGYGLEGCLTDVGTGNILDDYAIPHLSNNDYSTGLTEAYKAVTHVVCEEYGIELNPEYEINNYGTYEDSSDESDSDAAATICGAVMLVTFIVIIFKKFSGGSSGGSDDSDYDGGRGYRDTTSHSSFSGGSRGGFSGGGGGFRGGGGSFGGGGSSRGF